MKQQTAVEWLIEQLVELDKELDGRRKSDDSTVIKINPTKIYKQAKQMEKEQIINARLDGFKISAEGWNSEYPYEGHSDEHISSEINNEQYYNETYTNQHD